MNDCCETCRFFVPERLQNGKGTCHAGRPSMFVFIVPAPPSPIHASGQPNAQFATYGGWPPVMKDNWCAEFSGRLSS